jgi:cell growth-regulating nucleolar protein
MPWFMCESCGDTIKKPKVKAHVNQCAADAFSCIDCSATFDRWSVHGHVSCVTEHEKYALAATKPGQEGILAAARARGVDGKGGGGRGEGEGEGEGGPGSGGIVVAAADER